MKIIDNFKKLTNFGLVISWKFHQENKWVSALTPYLVNEIIKEFNPLIISSQLEYEIFKKRIKFLISMEPGWSAPKLRYDTTLNTIKAVFYSDPHNNTKEREKYFFKNKFDFVFSYYYYPFFYHFKNFPKKHFVHFPWSIPDKFVSQHKIKVRNTDVAIFGGTASEAYDIRNWCRQQSCVKNFNYSGVENKQLSDKEFFKWMSSFDAIVAAGSSKPIYDLVTPKYFEIASSGALLVGQYCKDLKLLGFNENNSLIFTKENFLQKIKEFKQKPDNYLKIREEGRKLVSKRHRLSERIKMIKKVFRIQ